MRQIDHWSEPRQVAGSLVGTATFEVPADLDLGYHTVRAHTRDGVAETSLIVTPRWLGLPDAMSGRRSWGFATQLYSVRSTASWGVGDLVDLADLAVWAAAEHGADFVLVNPLHAAEPVAPMEPSPYLPTTSRRFVNPLYLRVERIPEYADLDAAGRAESRGSCSTASGRSGRPGPHRPGHRRGPRSAAALQAVHAVARDAPAGSSPTAAYRRPRGRGPAGLRDLVRADRQEHGSDWPPWPADLQAPAVAGVAAVPPPSTPTQVDFHALAAVGARRAARRPRRAGRVGAGMSLGIMHDLAVGVHPGRRRRLGAAATSRRRASPSARRRTRSTRTARTGRSRRGGPTGWRSWPTRRSATWSRTVLRHAGGIRVDHIIGLFRLWWIPEGMPADRGHLRPLRPRGAGRHPGPRGAPRRRRRGRRGPRHRRAVGARVPRASAASSARRSCGSSRDEARRAAARRSAGASTAWRR